MLKLQLISDLHFEWLSNKEVYNEIRKITSHQSTSEKVNFLVIAGDLCNYRNIWWILNEFAKYYEHVFYVNGNHELYGSHIDIVREQKTRKDDHKISDNVHWLDNGKILLRNLGYDSHLEILGCTLWFPDLPGNLEKSRIWSDFKSILNFRDYVYKENEISQKFLCENVSENSIVVTHYLPTYQSVHKKYEGNPFNVFFVCDLSNLIKEKKPKLWLFGHTHEKFDYILGNTRLISNPKAYPGENTEKPFDYFKIIELEENSKPSGKCYNISILNNNNA